MFVVVKDNNIIAYSKYYERLIYFDEDCIFEVKFTQDEIDKFVLELNAEGKIVLGTSEIIKCEDTIVNDVVAPMTLKELGEENMLLKERLLQLEVAEVNRKSTEIEKRIIGGI